MRQGFLMVHREGLEVCRTPGDYAALIWLCRQGKMMEWRREFEATGADLCSASGHGAGWVRGFVRRMSAVGVITIVDPGDRRRPRTVIVSDPRPHEDQQVIQDPEQHADQTGEQNGRGVTPDLGAGDSIGDPVGGSNGRAPMDLEGENREETEIQDGAAGSTAKARARLERETALELWTWWREQRRPDHDGKRGRLWHTSKIFDDEDCKKVIGKLQARAKAHRGMGLRFPADLQAAAGDCRDLIECYHQAPTADHFQGKNQEGRVYLGLGTLFKNDKMGSRWETAAQWLADGKPSAAPLSLATANGFKAEAEKAWAWVQEQVAQHGMRLPRPLRHDDEAKDRATWKGIEAAGGVKALCGRTDTVQRLRWPFMQAYVAERQQETTQ